MRILRDFVIFLAEGLKPLIFCCVLPLGLGRGGEFEPLVTLAQDGPNGQCCFELEGDLPAACMRLQLDHFCNGLDHRDFFLFGPSPFAALSRCATPLS